MGVCTIPLELRPLVLEFLIATALASPVQEEVAALGVEAGRLADEGAYAEATLLAQKRVALLEGEGRPTSEELADAVKFAGVLFFYQRQDAEALAHYERARQIYREVLGTDSPSYGSTLENLAMVHARGGRIGTALPLAEEALAINIATHGDGDSRVASSLQTIAALHYHLREYSQAIDKSGRALAILEADPATEERRLATLRQNLGIFYLTIGDVRGAIPLFLDTLESKERRFGPDHAELVTVLTSLGTAHGDLMEFVDARRYFERALGIASAHFGDDHLEVARVANGFSNLLSQQGDIEAAEALGVRSLEIRHAQLGGDHALVARSLNDLGMTVQLAQPERARDYFVRARAIVDGSSGEVSIHGVEAAANLAGVLAILGDVAGARALYETALAAATGLGETHPVRISALHNLGWLELRHGGDAERAMALFVAALEVSESRMDGQSPRLIVSLHAVADAHQALGEAQEARPLVARAMDITNAFVNDALPGLSEREALRFIQVRRTALDHYLDAFDRPGDNDAAWLAMLHWKGGVGRALSRWRPDPDDPRAMSLAQVRRVQASLILDPGIPVEERRSRLGALSEERGRLERELAAENAAIQTQLLQKRATIADVCDALPSDAALVDYLRYKADDTDFYLAYVVDAATCEVRRVDLGPAEDIDEAVGRWRAVLSDQVPDERRERTRGEGLVELVWTPLNVDRSRVIVVPDAALTGVPFGALPTRDGYLIEAVAFSYLESALAALGGEPTPATDRALLVGGVDFSGHAGDVDRCVDATWNALPATGAEVQDVARLWRKRGESEILIGRGATERAVVAALPGKRLIHLATHGLFASGDCESALRSAVGFDPMSLSGLVLATESADSEWDGLLTAAEVSALDLSATEVVVLSACETGLGETQSGEGVLGLRRAFTAAGAQNLIMSLWSIPDDETATLMESFYRHHLRRDRSPIDALHAAQLDLLAQNRKSGDALVATWGAFIASGAW